MFKSALLMTFLVSVFYMAAGLTPTTAGEALSPSPKGEELIHGPEKALYVEIETRHGFEQSEIPFPLYFGKRWVASEGHSWGDTVVVVTAVTKEAVKMEVREGDTVISECTYRRHSQTVAC